MLEDCIVISSNRNFIAAEAMIKSLPAASTRILNSVKEVSKVVALTREDRPRAEIHRE